MVLNILCSSLIHRLLKELDFQDNLKQMRQNHLDSMWLYDFCHSELIYMDKDVWFYIIYIIEPRGSKVNLDMLELCPICMFLEQWMETKGFLSII